jgi:hypothetical protein
MKVHELRSALRKHPDALPRFILPEGDVVPAHFHVTEVGHVVKNFIDCGGTTRKNESAVLQLWFSDRDRDHRLRADKFADILGLGDRVLPHDKLEIEVEYDCCVISQYAIKTPEFSGEYLDFHLASSHTDCLAREKCGIGDNASGQGATASCC